MLRRINLNLLPILRELLRKANVTHAAKELNMSQPAVSEALSRLRLLLHDELLIPSGRAFTLSALAQRLQPELEETLRSIETLLAPTTFDPGNGVGKIRIATADYVALMLGAGLSKKFAEQAPSMSLEILDTHVDSNVDLRMGEIDMIIAAAGQITDEFELFNHAHLFDDEFVYLIATRDGKPRLHEGEDLSRRPHILYQPRGRSGFMSLGETLLRQQQDVIPEAARVPSFLLMPFMIEGTDNVALLQRRLAERFSALSETAIVEPRRPFPKMMIVALWNRSREHDPAHAWFRRILSEIPLELGL